VRTILTFPLVVLAACSSSKDLPDAGPCACAFENAGLAGQIPCGASGCYPVGGALRQVSCSAQVLSDHGGCIPGQGDGGGPACTPGAARCLGDTPQACDAGAWESASPCAAQQRCGSGQCLPLSSTSCAPDAGDSGCELGCTATSSCQFNSGTCPAGEACTAACTGTSSCQFSTVDCSQSTSCQLQCSNTSTCQFLVARCGPGDCNVQCQGTSSCQGTASQPAILDCSMSSSCEVTCSNTSTCQNLTVLCGSGPCTIQCQGTSACQGMNIVCGSGPCSATCTGTAAAIGAINCGASTSCHDTCP